MTRTSDWTERRREAEGKVRTRRKGRKRSDEGWARRDGSKNEGKSNAEAISQSTSAGRVGILSGQRVIFKTEDGAPAGILSDRREQPKETRGWDRRRAGEKKSRRPPRNIRANACEDDSARNWETEDEPVERSIR